MKQKTFLIIIVLVLCCVGTAQAQGPQKPKMCATCGKMVVNCPYKGKHPKPNANTTPQKPAKKNKQINAEDYMGAWEREIIDTDGTIKVETIVLDDALNRRLVYSYRINSLVIGEEEITYIIPFEYSIDSNMRLTLRLDKSKTEIDYFPRFNEEKRELFAKYPDEEKTWRQKRMEEIEKVKQRLLNSLSNVIRFTIKSCIGDKLILIDSKGKSITYTDVGMG